MTIINNSQATIDTVTPELKLGEIQLSADRRSTKEAPIADAERIRRVVIPATHWTGIAGSINGTNNQGLTDLLRSALQTIGSNRLRDTLAAAPMERVVNLGDYTVAALLAWNAESASSRGSITFTREQVEAWFKGSATAAYIEDKAMAAGKTAMVTDLLTFAKNRFATLAAKNHGLKTEEEVAKLTLLIAPDDLTGKDASLVAELVQRLDHIGKAMKARAAEATISMDDL